MSERWLGLHERDHSSHVLHRFGPFHDRLGQKRFLTSVEQVSNLAHAHLTAIETYGMCSTGHGVVVTPYTGNKDGVVTLAGLLALKGGRLAPSECDRALTHVLEAVEYAHAEVAINGPITVDQILVDRHGSLSIELYGLGRRLRGFETNGAESRRDEVRSVVELGYRLLTGLSADEPRIPASRLVKKLSPVWERWFDRGLDGVEGFATAGEALEMLPSNCRDEARVVTSGPVKAVLSRLWAGRSA